MNIALKVTCFVFITQLVKCFADLNCTCVPYYQCSDDFDELITDGVGLLDIRNYKIGSCKGYLDVCCNVTADLKTPTEATEESRGCGYQYSGTSPWSGALLHQEDASSPYKYLCGLSLIHNQTVLTAAHCVERNGILIAHIGEMLSVVEKIIIHHLFDSATFQNDIAILILKNPIQLTEKVNIICIPPPEFELERSECTVSVFNRNRFLRNPNLFFRVVSLSVIPKHACQYFLRNTRLGPHFQLHEKFICAIGKEDTCNGIGGSAMVCPIPSQPTRYHQTGIVSWSISCKEGNNPGVFVNLSLFRHWIDKVMIKNGYSVNDYKY